MVMDINATSPATQPAEGPLEGPCVARPDDLPGILTLTNQIFRPAPRPGDMAREFSVLLGPDNIGSLHVFRQAGKVVSHVGVLRQRIHTCGLDIPVACIGAVCTSPDCRKAGLAGQLMDLAIRRSIERGDLLMPISGRRTLYTGRGAASLGPILRFRVPLSVRDVGVSDEFTISAYEPASWQELADLQQGEPVRYQWGGREPQMLEALRSFGGICLLARRRSRQPAAALVFCVGHPMYGGQDGLGRVIQFLGDNRAIPSLLALIASSGLKGLDWSVLAAHKPETVQTLLSAGATCQASVTNWTVLILNLAGLVEKIAPLAGRAGVQLSAHGGTLVVAAEGQSVSLDQPAQQVEMLFRGQATWGAALAGLPSALRTACSGVFPIPLPEYGINYV